MTPLTCQRHEFALPPDVHYLNCAYMGPLPVRSQEAGIAGIRRKAVPTTISPDDFFSDSDAARTLFAAILGAADATRVAILPAVSYGIAIAARNLPCRAGQRIITAGEQFPSNVYGWRRLAHERGATVVAVPAPEAALEARSAAIGSRGARWNDALADAIDERTAILALPHVHWTDGTRFDLERLAARARDAGAAVVIDATQSLGALPFDFQAIRPDAVICAAYKWLLGPYSVSFGWFGPAFDDGVPLEETWIGREGSQDFQRLVDYREPYQPGALRYDMGERSNFIALPMAIESLRLVAGWGADRVQDYCDALMRQVIDGARDLGYTVEDRSWRGSHLFGLRLPRGTDLDTLHARLRALNVHASLRGSALRIAPFAYNDEADAVALLRALQPDR